MKTGGGHFDPRGEGGRALARATGAPGRGTLRVGYPGQASQSPAAPWRLS